MNCVSVSSLRCQSNEFTVHIRIMATHWPDDNSDWCLGLLSRALHPSDGLSHLVNCHKAVTVRSVCLVAVWSPPMEETECVAYRKNDDKINLMIKLLLLLLLLYLSPLYRVFTAIYLKQTMFLGYKMCSCYLFTICATRNVISHVDCVSYFYISALH